MKHEVIRRIYLIALFSGCGFFRIIDATDVRIRSQSVDTARELSGWTNHVNLYDMSSIYGTFAVTPEYTQSFNGRQIARSLFGNAIANNNTPNIIPSNGCTSSCNNDYATFRVSGSQATNRQAEDLLADYFGLPLDYQSTIYVRPFIKNFLVDFDFFLGLDEWLCGLWFRVHAPVVWANWKLRLCEIPSVTPALGYPAGYFAPAAVPVNQLNTSFMSYLTGNVPVLNGNVQFEPLQNAMMCKEINTGCGGNSATSCNKSNETTRLSDIRFALGWNFWQDEDYHVGLGILAAIPTGNRVNDKLIFQPMVGNGHHWELGGKFTSHYTFWRSCDYERSAGLFFDLDITHLFATRQFRVFDLCGRGDNSKYMLTEQMTSPVVDNLKGNTLASTVAAGPIFVPPANGYVNSEYQFNNIFTPVANIAAQDVNVSQDIQLDFTAMFNYTHCGFCWDVGYNFWLTSCEKIEQCSNLFQSNIYALKGDAYVIGFDSENQIGGLYQPVNLGATENNATICSGTNYPLTANPTPLAQTNYYIDTAQYAYGDSTNGTATNTLVYSPTAPISVGNQTETSIQSIFLTNNDLDKAGARAKGMSNKLFTHLSYTWEHLDCYIPYFGVGGKAEWARDNKLCSSTSCSNSSGCKIPTNTNSFPCSEDCNDNCKITNISEWGIWIKGGVSFD